MTTDGEQLALTLPGLEVESGQRPNPGNERAARRTLADLERAGLYTERQAALGEALLTCARQLDRAAASKYAKEYGVAQLLNQYRELVESLLPDDVEGGGSGDAFDQLAADLRRAARLGHGDDGRATAVRNPEEPATP